MTVEKYQRVYAIKSISKEDIERVCWMICECFNLTYEQVDSLTPKKFSNLVVKLNKRLNTNQGWFSLDLETDATKITLGQFIECREWLKTDPILNLHLLAASLLRKRKDHKKDADKILKVDIKKVHDKVVKFIKSFEDLIKSYKGLFETEAEEEQQIRRKKHSFPEQYGWMFSAKEVAIFEGIKLDEAYELNIIHALNTLSYLKSKASYEIWQSKQ